MIPKGPLPQFPPGFRTINGSQLQNLVELIGSNNKISAHAGGGKLNATIIMDVIIEVDVCASDYDSVGLPNAYSGLEVLIWNNTSKICRVFSLNSDTIQRQSPSTGYDIEAGASQIFKCNDDGNWIAAATNISTAIIIPIINAFFASLPTVLPAQSGVVWNNGGTVCIS